MARKAIENEISKVKFTYTGTEENLDQFLTVIVKDYMVKNKLIDKNIVSEKGCNKV